MIDVVNAVFNEKLCRLTTDNADKVIFSLGMPSDILLSTGIEEREIRFYANKLLKKAKLHNFVVSDLINLPEAVNDPIAVFDDVSEVGGSHRILTRLRIGNDNLILAAGLGKKGMDAVFNVIYTAFGKPLDRITRWINNRNLLYVNKEKALSYLISTPAPNAGAISNREPKNTDCPRTPALIAGATDNRELVEAINIVNSFVNPILFKDNTFPPQMSIPQNNFSNNGGKHARS